MTIQEIHTKTVSFTPSVRGCIKARIHRQFFVRVTSCVFVDRPLQVAQYRSTKSQELTLHEPDKPLKRVHSVRCRDPKLKLGVNEKSFEFIDAK